MKKTKRAVVYCRVADSPIMRSEDAMMPQVEMCRRKLKEMRYTEVACFEVWGKSGIEVESVYLSKLIRMARNNEIEAVFVYDWTRLSRDIFWYEVIREYLEIYGVKILHCQDFGEAAQSLIASFKELWRRSEIP